MKLLDFVKVLNLELGIGTHLPQGRFDAQR